MTTAELRVKGELPNLGSTGIAGGPILDRTAEITFLDAGAQAYVVTYGQRPDRAEKPT